MDLRKIITKENTTLIDVREPYEFAAGHASGAINIPLGSISQRVNEIKEMSLPIVVYCQSGRRSANAMGLLKAHGIEEVYNGGSLDEVFYYQKQEI